MGKNSFRQHRFAACKSTVMLIFVRYNSCSCHISSWLRPFPPEWSTRHETDPFSAEEESRASHEEDFSLLSSPLSADTNVKPFVLLILDPQRWCTHQTHAAHVSTLRNSPCWLHWALIWLFCSVQANTRRMNFWKQQGELNWLSKV